MSTVSQAPSGTELQELAKRHLWMHFTRMGSYDAEHPIRFAGLLAGKAYDSSRTWRPAS